MFTQYTFTEGPTRIFNNYSNLPEFKFKPIEEVLTTSTTQPTNGNWWEKFGTQQSSYNPKKGDVVVINKDDKSNGHVAIYNGSQWISDFKQKNANPYSQDVKSIKYYRSNNSKEAEQAADEATSHAGDKSTGWCARAVRRAFKWDSKGYNGKDFNKYFDSNWIQVAQLGGTLNNPFTSYESVRVPTSEINLPELKLLEIKPIKQEETKQETKQSTGNWWERFGTQSNSSSNNDIVDYLMKKGGFTREQAQGIKGNLMQESGLKHNAVNQSSGAYGLAQWLGSRKTNLFNKYGNNPTQEQQLDFLIEELNSSEKKAGDALRNAKTAEEAARTFMTLYERPGNDGSLNKRIAYAKA